MFFLISASNWSNPQPLGFEYNVSYFSFCSQESAPLRRPPLNQSRGQAPIRGGAPDAPDVLAERGHSICREARPGWTRLGHGVRGRGDIEI